jgi:hypothetical protein
MFESRRRPDSNRKLVSPSSPRQLVLMAAKPGPMTDPETAAQIAAL